MQWRRLEEWLRVHGARLAEHGSRHDIRRREERHATLPRHAEINTVTAWAVCDQLGVPRPPWR